MKEFHHEALAEYGDKIRHRAKMRTIGRCMTGRLKLWLERGRVVATPSALCDEVGSAQDVA